MLSYILHFKGNMKDLRDKRGELETLKRQIEREAEDGERKRKMIGPFANEWLQEVQAFLAGDDEWSDFTDENKIKEKDKCCFGLLHCNLKYRYFISKRATKKFEIIEKKIKKMEGRSSRAVTLLGEPPELGSMPTAHSKNLASRELTLNKIMEALKDKEVHMIGICGMEGVGKSTLIEEVARRAEVDGSFKAVTAEVFQTPDVLKMQQQIAERIGLQLQGLKSADERAREIYKALNKLNHEEKDDQMSKNGRKQVVVILDNIWNKLNLNGVGIPANCKIVLTTTSELVCHEMGADKKFVVDVLNDKEATELFFERVGRLADHDDGYKSMTDELVKKCGGLPLAIVALASTLRDRNLSDWRHVAAQLRSSVLGRVGGAIEENVYPIIERSYNFITYSWATELKSLSLLLEAEDQQHVKIHDIARDALMSIAAKGENIFHVGTFSRWLLKETCRTYTAISMTSEDNHEPLSRFKFPKLEMLLLKGSKPFVFPDNFFQWMKSLKVLVISDMKFQTLPSSINQLKNLRTLHLEYCELSDISEIALLVDLVFLSLRESKIDELPKELENLAKLKLLDLTGCSTLEKIPVGVIAGLTDLEGLYMMNSFRMWDSNFESSSKKDEPDDDKKMASLIELKSLCYLNILEIYVPSIQLLANNLLFRCLSRFFISIGIKKSLRINTGLAHRFFYEEMERKHHSKVLLLRNISWPLQQCIKCLLKETEYLLLEGISGLENIMDSLDIVGCRNLKSLRVQNCSGMECIVTAYALDEEGGAFPELEKLVVASMDNLKVICDGLPSRYRFHHLKELILFDLGCLRNFWNDRDIDSNQPFFNEEMKFPVLEKLTIRDVRGIVELWHLADIEEKDPAFPNLVSLKLQNLTELRSIWKSKDIIIHRSFRNLKSLKVYGCPKLETLCPLSVAAALEQLDTLEVWENENMKEIIANKTGEMNNNNTEMTIFSRLRIIVLILLPNLKCFLRGSIKLVFPSLESIHCYKLKEMVAFVSSEYPGDPDELFNDKVALPAIKRIKMSYVNGLQEIWGSHLDDRSFNELESLEMTFVGKVSKVFSLNIIKQMQNLKKLDLQQFYLAEEFIEHIGFYNEDVEHSTLLPQLKELRIDSFSLLKQIQWREQTLQNLCYLKISKIHSLTSLFPTSVGRRLVNLEELDVSDCKIMKEIVGRELGETNAVEVKVVFPQLNTLILGNLPALRSLSSDNVIIEFPSIKEVVFDKFENPIQLDWLQSLQHVKQLRLGGCESLLKSYNPEGLAFAFPPQLRTLKLYDMHNLQEIPWMVFPTEKIRYLNISNIGGLKFLFPAASMCSERFARLEKIHIDNKSPAF